MALRALSHGPQPLGLVCEIAGEDGDPGNCHPSCKVGRVARAEHRFESAFGSWGFRMPSLRISARSCLPTTLPKHFTSRLTSASSSRSAEVLHT